MKKYQFVIILGVITLFTLVTFGIAIYNFKNIKSSEANTLKETTSTRNSIIYNRVDENNYTIETSNAEILKISPDATIIFDKYYKKCGHTIVTREPLTKDMVNLTQDKFKKMYNDWQLIKFTNDEIELKKEFEGECEEHYLVKELEGKIGIYRIEGSGDIQLLEKTEISTQYLAESDIENLKEGVTLVGKEALNAYIENFE